MADTRLTGSEVINESVIVSHSFARVGLVLFEVMEIFEAVGAIVSCIVTPKDVWETFGPGSSTESWA